MTSLNAGVIIVRLVISLFVQRTLSVTFGEAGIAKIGQLRNLLEILTSTSSLGIFNGVVKYVSENENDTHQMRRLFSTSLLFVVIGSMLSTVLVFFNAETISLRLFGDFEYLDIIKYLSVVPLIIGLNRLLYGFINGLSDYKKHAKIELLTYLLSIALLFLFLYLYSLMGVLFAILLSPLVNLLIIVAVFYQRLKSYIRLKTVNLDVNYVKPLLAFTLMSFVSTVLLNYIELDIRTTITNRINIEEAGYWTAMNYISKNYMVFSSSIFTLYVIPKFAKIDSGTLFKTEVFHIYKTLLPLFGLGMIAVYLMRNIIISIIYPNFEGLDDLFKWQLLGDFVRLATLVVSHQFLAKKMVKSFVITELFSLGLFYFLSKYLVDIYGAEGVVMAHLYRYIIYFSLVIGVIWYYFKNKNNKTEDE